MLSAHAALGHEWELVVIAGLQEGLWPNTIPRGGVLGTQRLLDVLDGVDQNASMRAPLLAEERRLLVAAMGRARKRLLVTAIDGEANGGDEASMPSPFFAEIAQWATGDDEAAWPDGDDPLRPASPRGDRRCRWRRRGCCRPPRWWAGCAVWCAHRETRSATRHVPARQRN